MSRILARVLGGPAGPDPVRPRLPSRFEPGLDMASEPVPPAAEPDGIGPGETGPYGTGPDGTGPDETRSEDIAADDGPADARAATSGSPAVSPNDRRTPADSPAEPAPAAPGSPRTQPVPAKRQPASAPWPATLAGPAQAVLAEPSRLDDADPARPGRSWPAHPVRPARALPQLSELPAPQPPAAESAADRLPPSERVSAATAVPEPFRGSRLPDPRLAPAPRRAASREVRGVAEAEPTVHITIGQVEIRADRRAAVQPARLAEKPRRVAPDLSEYLQRRGRQR